VRDAVPDTLRLSPSSIQRRALSVSHFFHGDWWHRHQVLVEKPDEVDAEPLARRA
jgi:hypothetical protein